MTVPSSDQYGCIASISAGDTICRSNPSPVAMATRWWKWSMRSGVWPGQNAWVWRYVIGSSGSSASFE